MKLAGHKKLMLFIWDTDHLSIPSYFSVMLKLVHFILHDKDLGPS